MPYPILGMRPYAPQDPGALGAIEWHRADAVTFFSGANIQSFADLSGNGRSVSLSGGNVNTRAVQLPASAPNGQPSASCPNPFAGFTTGYHGTLNYQLQQAGGAFSIFSVLKPDAAVDGNAAYRFAYASSDGTTAQFDGANHWWTPFDTPDQLRASMTDSPIGLGGAEVGAVAGQWAYSLFCIDWGAGTIRSYLLGGLYKTDTVGDVADRTLLGCYFLRGSEGGPNLSVFNSWFGEVADLAVFAHAVDNAGQLPLLNQYVEARYGPTMVTNAGAQRQARRFARRGRIYVPASLAC